MKLIVCAKTNKVLGLHMCGEDSPEIVQVLAVVATVVSKFLLVMICEFSIHLVLQLLKPGICSCH